MNVAAVLEMLGQGGMVTSPSCAALCKMKQIKAWRRLLHQYDEGLPKEEAPAPGSAGRNVTVVELLGQETGSRFSAQDEQVGKG